MRALDPGANNRELAPNAQAHDHNQCCAPARALGPCHQPKARDIACLARDRRARGSSARRPKWARDPWRRASSLVARALLAWLIGRADRCWLCSLGTSRRLDCRARHPCSHPGPPLGVPLVAPAQDAPRRARFPKQKASRTPDPARCDGTWVLRP